VIDLGIYAAAAAGRNTLTTAATAAEHTPKETDQR